MNTGKPFQEVELPEQKRQDDGVVFPAVLLPNTSTNATATELNAFEDAIRAHKPWLESILLKSGAILFRGFPVISPSDFNCVVEAFGFPELSYMGGAAPRTQVVGRVYTANESSLYKEIPFHHEMAYLPNPPTKLFFFCEEEPRIGGETPIVLSHIIYIRMKDKHPDFVSKMEEHVLTYMKIACDDDDPSSYAGSSWKTAFKTDDKNIAEERAAKLAGKLKWTGNSVKMISSSLPVKRIEEESGRKTWFNSLAVAYCGPATENVDNHNTSVELGNGSPVGDDAVKYLLKVMKEECVAIPWKKGNVVLVNNLTVLHSRRPLIKPPRRIPASMCK
ncbi:clavaminate synthase-like protein At3g21360 [Bidens hawaiensis]|uniref:clavaminate synthase-like protein At3g21360 n=1 Tax=Bidens hawaiensis TaxID=980011 RepID=UPI00404968F3